MAVQFTEASSQFIDALNEIAALRTTASLSFWITTTQVGNDTVWDSPGVSGNEEAGADDDIFWGVLDNNSGNSRVTISKGNGSRIPTNQVNDGSRHHIVLTWNSSTGTCTTYQNGVLINSGGTATGDVGLTFSRIASVEDTGGTPRYLDAVLEDVRVYNRILTLAEVQKIYRSRGGDGIVNGLVHRWMLDEGYPGESLSGSGASKDIGSGQNNGTPTNAPQGAESGVGVRRRRAS